ncbi:MAG: SAM-dependent methyltransferase [Friedmanniella sp.]|nr:SAM-dependent methyltransferase [Friedmanniella sp.]
MSEASGRGEAGSTVGGTSRLGQNETVNAPEDAVDRILLAEAVEGGRPSGPVATVDDPTGFLTLALARAWAGSTGSGATPDEEDLRAYADSAAEDRAATDATTAAGAVVEHATTLAGAVADAELVVLRLPKSLAALDEIAATVAAAASPTVRLLAGGRVKHMTRGMNDVLARHFGSVRASLGVQKSRVLVAERPVRPAPGRGPDYPRSERHEDLGLTVWAHGSAFAGTGVDLGTRLLLSQLDRLPAGATTVVDLGCGTGLLATAAARQLPEATVWATDDSRAAVWSTTATARANGVGDQVRTRWWDSLADLGPASVDVVVCNPPFHRGTAKDSGAALAMFADAARVLRPGGELWVVFNSHLPYLPVLRRVVGSTIVATQDPHYLVTRSTRGRTGPRGDGRPTSAASDPS